MFNAKKKDKDERNAVKLSSSFDYDIFILLSTKKKVLDQSKYYIFN